MKCETCNKDLTLKTKIVKVAAIEVRYHILKLWIIGIIGFIAGLFIRITW